MYIIGHNNIVSSGEDGLSLLTSLTNSIKLTYLAIDSNLLEGVTPESIGNLSKALPQFYMGGNRIYGKIPSSIGLKSLTFLNMSSNLISGEIPIQIGELEDLQMLGLVNNRISGVIPSLLGNLQKLSNVDLLHGSILKESLNLPSLSTIFNLANNFLSGALPNAIGFLEKVITIDLSNNLFPGNIRSSIKNCKSLEELFMAHNRFSGLIPTTLGQIKGLQVLDLTSNQLSESIPDALQKLQTLKERKALLELKMPKSRGCTWKKTLKSFLHGCFPINFSTILDCWLSVALSMEAKSKNYGRFGSVERCNATQNFSHENLSGNRGFGSAYEGQIGEGNVIAVKVLNTQRTACWKSIAVDASFSTVKI
ncbi:hypothetical protein TIFTF001_055357 [Ficus carica]|uniref:Uncharacterized protein n=1 Tax=Ficus carica TaxID=3494 RepID=A0AA88JGR0_FICCA|nr:hypothetical protein TIFTF001_055356 [Ficus carica]GMN73570.1 hypothetical protein TIFTF001_055357 [Ficus carica]